MVNNNEFQFAVTTSLVDDDALNLIIGLIQDVKNGVIPAHFTCIVSTRQVGDNTATDHRLSQLQEYLKNTRTPSLITFSAKKFGCLTDKGEERRTRYDTKLIETIQRECYQLPSVALYLGDMIIHSKKWSNIIPSLNLHPDLPLSKGGTEGIYWDVIGKWIAEGRDEAGGMIHLATPQLDAGSAVAYFRIPLKGVVDGVDLGELWHALPTDRTELERLIAAQTDLKDKPTHSLFQELRRAEAQFEPELIRQTLMAFATGRLSVQEGHVLNHGDELTGGLDLSHEVVGKKVLWPGKEGTNHLRNKEL